jgi:hypothetical protein
MKENAMKRYFTIGLAMLAGAALGAGAVPMRQWVHIYEIEV